MRQKILLLTLSGFYYKNKVYKATNLIFSLII